MSQSEMWNRVDWLKPVDIAIISLLSGSKNLKLTPGNIAKNIEYQPSYVATRARVLVEKGILEVSEDGTDPYFSTTELGERIFNRNVSVEKLQELGDDPDDE